MFVSKNNKPIKNKTASYANAQEVQDRLVLRLINEATACLREGIVEDKELIDAGVIFGTGFAPFRGGPLEYIKRSGKERCAAASRPRAARRRSRSRCGRRTGPQRGSSPRF
mgnify:CR=1 FL=1